MNIYSHEELAELLSNKSFSAYSIDSRLVGPGSLFFAFKGMKADGHDFLAEVAASGGTAAVVSSEYQGESHGLSLYHTLSPKQVLQSMARLKLENMDAKIVAVTGSLGKTTTKGFLQVLLEKKYKVFVTPGNNNSQLGLPIAVLNFIKGDENLIVLEMGMSQPGEIRQLVDIAPPNVALLTHVDAVHIANFNSLNEIASEKAEIFSHPKTEIGFIPQDVFSKEEIASRGSCQKAFYSLSSPEGEWLLSHPLLNFPGRHNYQNLLGAVSVARYLGLQDDEIEERLPYLVLPERRLEFNQKRGVTFINDSYNAAALSVKAALDAMPPPEKGGRKFAILGEMLELGKYSEAYHRDVGEYALDKVDVLYLFGEGCRPILECWKTAQRPAFIYQDQEVLIADLKRALQSGDVALVKGSQSKKMWEVIEKV